MADHPILDRYPLWRAYADRHGLHCTDDTWLGWNRPYTIVCDKGHASRKHLHQWTKARQPCRQCADDERMALLHTKAASIGATCLDATWKGPSARYGFRCQQGHTWSRSWPACFKNMQCAICVHEASKKARLRANGLDSLRQAAVARDGACESDTYLGSAARYGFRCTVGHQWQTTGQEVLRGSWCGICANNERKEAYLLPDGLLRLQAMAASKSGICLAAEYVGSNLQYAFRCAGGHEWRATGARILRGSWCLRCTHDAKRLSIGHAQEVAATRGGQCLSTTYISSSVKLTWICEKGHVWQAAFGSIKQNHWCPECAIQRQITNRKSTMRSKYQPSSRHG